MADLQKTLGDQFAELQSILQHIDADLPKQTLGQSIKLCRNAFGTDESLSKPENAKWKKIADRVCDIATLPDSQYQRELNVMKTTRGKLIQRVQELVAAAEQQLGSLKAQLEDATQRAETAENAKKELEGQLEEEKQQHQLTRNALNNALVEVNNLKTRIAALDEVNAQLQAGITRVTEERDQWQTQAEALEQQVQQLTTHYEGLLATANAQLEELKRLNEALGARVTQLEQQIAATTAERDEAKRQLLEAQQQLRLSQESLNAERNKVLDANNKLGAFVMLAFARDQASLNENVAFTKDIENQIVTIDAIMKDIGNPPTQQIVAVNQ